MDSDGASEPGEDEGQPALFEVDPEPDPYAESQAWMDVVMAGPPRWFRILQWLLMGGIALVLALTVMLQWVVWLMVTGLVFFPWGMGVGLVIVAAQILAIFGNEARRERASCAIPRA